MPGTPMPVGEENDFHAPLDGGAIAQLDANLHYGDEIIQDDQAIETYGARESWKMAKSQGYTDDDRRINLNSY